VNALDEVPDSSWFQNRIGARPMTPEEVARGACTEAQLLRGQDAEDASWVVDQGKQSGSQPGFRINIKGKGKYLLKIDGLPPERSSTASVVGAAIYNAVGFNTSCEQIVFVRRTAFKLEPGLTYSDNTGIVRNFDQKKFDEVLDTADRRGEFLRFQASAWLPGHLIGPFRYEGERDDDPNDAIPHEDRRDLRATRLVAAWIEHHDSREQNSMDAWFTTNPNGPKDGSPGYVRHYFLDMSDAMGGLWDWDRVSRRLGYTYVLDWPDMGRDFITLGIPERPWDRADQWHRHLQFGYFSADDFVPEDWKNEYMNVAFDHMVEDDAAWMARILAHFTPAMIHRLAERGILALPDATDFLAMTLEARLEKVLDRYLTRLSPIGQLAVEGNNALWGVDLARMRNVRPPDAFRYVAELHGENGAGMSVPVVTDADGKLRIDLPHVARADGDATESGRYVVVKIWNGVAKAPLEAHLYDLGPTAGYRLAGVLRPEQ
jgi:hypothetical protein